MSHSYNRNKIKLCYVRWHACMKGVNDIPEFTYAVFTLRVLNVAICVGSVTMACRIAKKECLLFYRQTL